MALNTCPFYLSSQVFGHGREPPHGCVSGQRGVGIGSVQSEVTQVQQVRGWEHYGKRLPGGGGWSEEWVLFFGSLFGLLLSVSLFNLVSVEC